MQPAYDNSAIGRIASHPCKKRKDGPPVVLTGKMEPWKTFGEETGSGVTAVVPPRSSSDGSAYAYLYVRVLSEVYVVTGLK